MWPTDCETYFRLQHKISGVAKINNITIFPLTFFSTTCDEEQFLLRKTLFDRLKINSMTSLLIYARKSMHARMY